MGRPGIEIILMRQLASYLAVPILIVDHKLDLLFFNESAEPILGCRFDETGEIRRNEWTRLFRPADAIDPAYGAALLQIFLTIRRARLI